VLADADGQRAFLEHFHDGLLDDELRALADVPANLAAFARVNGDPRAITGTSLRDSVDGPGHGRFLYKLQAVNAAGLASGVTLALGPYYTRRVTPPPAPVLLKTQPQPRLPALILAWALVDDPEIAGYLVYRADDPRDLADLRFSGAAVGEVGPAALAALTWQPTRNPALAFDGPGAIDPRILAVVPDPRLFARDREGSNMAEVVLPTGVAPTEILAVHRASEYRDTSPPHDQPQAFNYFTAPNRGGIATLVPGPPARITGLRVGLGRGATVVVVARVASVVQVYGVLPAPRATYVDGAAGVLPLDRSTLAGRAPTNGQSAAAYALVAVDRFGNRSAAAPPSLVPPFYSPP
jgi:hypothetical protein